MNKLFIGKVLLMTILGLGSLGLEASANEQNLAKCLKERETLSSIQSSTSEGQFDYYLVNIESSERAVSYPNVLRLDRAGNCSVAVNRENLRLYPLSNFLGETVAYNLLLNKYQSIMNELGGKEAFINALIDELDAGTPHPFFYDQVEALKSLGVDLEEIDSFLVIVGEEGIPAHPELNFE